MKIELLPNPNKDRDYAYTRRTAAYLMDNGAELWLSKEAPAIEGVKQGPCPAPDLLLVLGGDGSMIRASKRASKLDIPLLGVNLGRIGFLAEIGANELGQLSKVLRNEYEIEERMMLDVAVMRGGTVLLEERVALNDAVVSHGRVSRLLGTEVLCNGNSLGQYHSDGFIAATPTGSTAYSLSAGGPLLDPSLRGIALTPICPHSLTARPIIVPEESVIEIRYLSPEHERAHLTVDGEEASELLPGDRVIVRRSALKTKLIRLVSDHKKSFYDILREKMSDT